jgi:outer membrane biosynthesis protein TonB
VNLLRKPGLRFVLEALAIVLTAVITGVLHLAWWQIGACVLIVLLGAVFVESWLARGPAPAQPVQPAPIVPAEPEVPAAHVRVVREPEPEPIAVEPSAVEPVPESEPEPEPAPIPPPTPPPPPLPAAGPWNVWELERALRESGDHDEEKAFLLHYLRDYAGPDGTLPAEFDDLVRESFASLLGATT